MAKTLMPSFVFHYQRTIDIEGLPADYEKFNYIEYYNHDRHVQIYKYRNQRSFTFNIIFDEFHMDTILSRVFIKKPDPADDQPTEVQFKVFPKCSEFKFVRVLEADLWKYIVDDKLTLITEWKEIDYELQSKSLENLTLQHLMLNLSKKNVLEVLEIADIFNYKNLKTQCINLIKIHIDELKDTSEFANLKTQLKDSILNSKNFFKDRCNCQLLQCFRIFDYLDYLNEESSK